MPNQDHLHLSLSQSDNCHYGPWENYQIQKNTTYSITIQFNDTWVYFKINNDIHINEKRVMPGLMSMYDQNLNIWMSTDRPMADEERPWENYNATLSNITIRSWDLPTPQPTMIPTIHPTQNPTLNPTNHPSGVKLEIFSMFLKLKMK